DEVAEREVGARAGDEVDAGPHDGVVGQLIARAEVDLVDDEAARARRGDAVKAVDPRRVPQRGHLAPAVHGGGQDVAQEGPGVVPVLGKGDVAGVADPADAAV